MSTQQQIQAWQTALNQKQQERADQETILRVQREQLAAAEEARNNAALNVQRAVARGAPDAEVRALVRQVDQFEDAESDARIASARTEDNIGKLDGSIRYNQNQLNLYQGNIPAQANPASTVDDVAANAASDAAETAPAAVPAANSPEPVPPSQAGDNGGFVQNAQGELVPADSAEAEEIRAEQNRVEAEAAAPLREFVTDPVTGEQVPSDSDRAAEIRADEAADENRVQTDAPAAVPGSAIEEGGEAEAGAPVTGPAPVVQYDEFGNEIPSTPEAIAAAEQKAAEQRAAEAEAAAKLAAINQATLQSVYKQVGSSDWRVRLQLAETSNYFYNAGNNGKLDGSAAGILAPLAATNGVIFPYTPAINTSYKANYEQYDLVHSNYRGLYYKNSRVDDLNIRATFTAQDTNEADYLLAVIHFFRSVTKMFYGQDQQRGTPPPLVYLSGLGMNQFYGHPCVVSNFQYNLPDNVDYIRATNVNNYGTDLLSRRYQAQGSRSNIAGLGATANRIVAAGLEKFFPSPKPVPDTTVANVTNGQLANYVPTKMEIDLTLIPVQTRSQVSKQFSLREFANGDLIKKGFW